MKINASNELKTRLLHASMNGSIIARDILAQINSNDDIAETLRGTANYFGTKRKRNSTGDGYTKIKVIFTACNKNLSNTNFPDHGNPQAPWFKENRTDMEPATFVRCFARLPEYPDSDMEYINIGEFLGVVEAAKYIIEHRFSPAIIYTDSLTALTWFNEKRTASRKRNVAIKKAEVFLKAMASEIEKIEVLHWNNSLWGETPADFGEK